MYPYPWLSVLRLPGRAVTPAPGPVLNRAWNETSRGLKLYIHRKGPSRFLNVKAVSVIVQLREGTFQALVLAPAAAHPHGLRPRVLLQPGQEVVCLSGEQIVSWSIDGQSRAVNKPSWSFHSAHSDTHCRVKLELHSKIWSSWDKNV